MPILPTRGGWRVALTLGLVAIFLLEGAPAGIAHAAGEPSELSGAPMAPGPHAAGQPSFAGFSEQTLELLNGTLVPGNRDPPTGLDPVFALADPTAGKIFALSSPYSAAANLDVINSTSDGVIVELPVAGATGASALDAPAGFLLLGVGGPNGLLVVNTTTDAVAARVPFPDFPGWLTVDPLNGLAYVLGNGGPSGGDVTVVNVTSDSVVTTIQVGSIPDNIVVDTANGDLYVANSAWGVANASGGTVSVIDGSNNTVVATIHTGNWPMAMAVDAATDTVYILDQDGPINLTVVNGTTNTVNASIPLPTPYNSTGFLAVDPVTSLLYVGQEGLSYMSLLSAINNSYVRNVSVGDYASEMVLDPTAGTVAVGGYGTLTFLGETNSTILGQIYLPNYNGAFSVDPTTGRLYIPNSGTGQIQVVNGSSHTYVTNVTIGLSPDGILYDPSSGDLYVTEPYTAAVSLVNGSTQGLAGTVQTGRWASQITLCPSADRVAITNSGAGTVSLLNATTNALVATTRVGVQPASTVWDSLDGDLFVADLGNDNVTVLNGTTGAVVTTISGFHSPQLFALDPANREVYVVGPFGGPVSVINATTFQIVANVSLGNGTPVGLAYDPATAQVWGVTDFPNVLMAISGSTNTVVTRVTVPTGGQDNGMAIDPSNGTILVTVMGYSWYGRVFFFNPSTGVLQGRATVGWDPGDVLFDPAQGLGLVANVQNNTISVLNLSGEVTVATFPTGPELTNLALDPATSTIYATNAGAGTLTVLGPAFPYPVQFHEVGLPIGTNWSVSLAGENSTSTNATVQFGANNGTDAFVVPPLAGYNPEPSTGNLTVGGAGLSVNVTFLPAYPVDFTEFGLPNGTAWSVTLNGSTATAVGPSIVFPEPNGSYRFNVADIPGWRSSAYSGTLLIQGGGAAEALNWTRAVYSVNFTASGLPTGKSWAVIIDNTTYRSSLGSIIFPLVNGSYTFSIAGAPGFAPERASGSFDIWGGPVTWTIQFTVGYLVQFWETGLPGGTPWAVALNGSLNFSSNSTVGFEMTNGTFGYTVSNVPGWRADAYAGTVTVSIPPAAYFAVYWNRTVYPVSIAEAGLPAGTNWSVTFGTDYLQLSTYAVSILEPNGSIPFTVDYVPGWRATAYSGVFNVSGRPRELDVNWTQSVFPVSFQETGLPAQMTWQVTLRLSWGSPPNASASTGPVLRFLSANGSYQFNVIGIAGWRADPSSGILTMAGTPLVEEIVWTKVALGLHLDEQGLPAGTSWAVTVRGATNRTNDSALSFSLPNGTYAWNVSNVPGWRTSVYHGSVTVRGRVENATVDWTPATYTATVVEADVVPPNPVWTVVLNGTAETGNLTDLSFGGLVNGTYSLVVRPPAGYVPATMPPAGVVIAGGSAQVVIPFLRSPAFASSGSLHLATWEILLGGAAIAAAVLVVVSSSRFHRRRPPGGGAPGLPPSR